MPEIHSVSDAIPVPLMVVAARSLCSLAMRIGVGPSLRKVSKDSFWEVLDLSPLSDDKLVVAYNESVVYRVIS